MFEHHQPSATPAHPLSGAAMTGADMIVQILADEGVDILFGYSGGAILPTFDAVFRFNQEHGDGESVGCAPLPLVVPANEQGATFMAAGYARSTGKVGVAMVTSGPGATNTVTPVRDCMADSVPIVVICGQVPTAAIGTDAFQEAPVSSIMGAACKHVFLVTDTTKLEATMRTAFEIARTGRPGPVVIDIPKDVQNWEGAFDGAARLPVPGYRQRMARLRTNKVDNESAREFYKLLGQSKRPLIYAGGGVVNGDASEALRRFADAFEIPVVTTLMGIGATDTTEPRSLHMLGMHGMAYANYAVDDCDFLICVAARFDDRVAGVPDQFAPRAMNIAHFDIDVSEIGKVKAAQWHHVGALTEALNDITDFGVERNFGLHLRDWHKHVARLRKEYGLNYDRDSALIQPYHVIETLNDLAKGEAIVSTGVGQHQMWAAQYFDYKHPRHWLTSGSMGTMGFGLPAAIGAQFAHPNKLVIDIDGDSSMRMNLGELETVTTYGLPIKVVVLNNYGDGMVKQWQKLFFRGRLAASDRSLCKKDFILAAKADGFEYAVRLDSKDDVARVCQEFIEFDGPAFLEVMIDPDACVYPMVGPGQSYRQMVTGPYIKSRYDEDDDVPTPTGMF